MHDVEILKIRNVRGRRVTVDCEREHATESWLMTLRVDDVLYASLHSDDPPSEAEAMILDIS